MTAVEGERQKEPLSCGIVYQGEEFAVCRAVNLQSEASYYPSRSLSPTLAAGGQLEHRGHLSELCHHAVHPRENMVLTLRGMRWETFGDLPFAAAHYSGGDC